MARRLRIRTGVLVVVVCAFVPPVRGQNQDLGIRADFAASSSSLTMLEAEIAELRDRLDVMDQVGVGKPSGEENDTVCPGWLVSVDYLNWDVRQRGTDFAITTDDSALSVGQGSVHHLEMDRNSGVRTGLGYRTGSGWELGLGYTYYQTDGTVSAAEPANGNMWATRSHPNQNQEAATADASGEFSYSVFDLEARYPLVRRCPVAVQIFGGLRWADIDQAFRVAYDGVDFDRAQYSDTSSATGFGLRLGAESQWRWNSSWSLFGSAAGSILYGRFHTRLFETNVAGADTIVDVRDDYGQAVPVLDAALGVAWNRGPVQVRAGYEMANWFNLADRSMFPDNVHEGAYAPLSEDVLLEGFFIRLSYTH